MITYKIDPNDAYKIAAHLDRAKALIVKTIRQGMSDAMAETAEYIVSAKLSGNPLQSRTGRLARAILSSVRARIGGGQEYVRGTLSDLVKEMPNEGLWQEEGTKHLDAAKLAGKLRVFVAADGALVFTKNIKPFVTPPKPFFGPSIIERERAIFETIWARVSALNLDAA